MIRDSARAGGGRGRPLVTGVGTTEQHLTPLGSVVVQKIRARRRRLLAGSRTAVRRLRDT